MTTLFLFDFTEASTVVWANMRLLPRNEIELFEEISLIQVVGFSEAGTLDHSKAS